MNNLPFNYYFYGSKNSIDTDVLIEITSDIMPLHQEDRKRYIKYLENTYDLHNWNINLVVIQEGVVIDTVYPKTWIDSVNNSLYNTYHLHNQVYDLPIRKLVKRNKLLAIYKTVRTILAMTTRTDYRKIVKPIINGCHDFNKKIEVLKQLDFTTIIDFNQVNMKNEDVWKVLAFYLQQNISLIRDGIEIYTKNDIIQHNEKLRNFIERTDISYSDKEYFNELLKYYINDILIPFGKYNSLDGILSCNDEVINMKRETF